jgi:ABC-type phosphate transport system substrate-binding protein
MRNLSIVRISCAAAVVGALTVTRWADAAPPLCSSLANPVYVSGSSAVQPVLQKVSQTLQALASPITLVYYKQGSCVGLQDITMPNTEKGTGTYWDNTATAQTCNSATGVGDVIDVGVSDVYPTTCAGITLGTTQKEFQGPIQTMTFVVPKASTESSISADAAVVMGWAGTMYPVAPWTDHTQIFIRTPTSGTESMIGTAIGLVSSKWSTMAVSEAGSGNVLTAIQGATANPNAAIGILATDVADAHRDTVKILAYQHTGQSCGYLPDSTATALDKINVRQGRYAIWGPLHLVSNVDANGNPIPGTGNPAGTNVATVMNYFTRNGLTDADTQTMIQNEAAAHTIPQCAMQISRMAEVGAEMSYQPPKPCGCYYESLVTGAAPTSCKACPNGNADCADGGTPTCRYGFCEAQ